MVYYGNERKKDLTAKQIYDRFSVGYYEEEIREQRNRIHNIYAGKGDRTDKYTYVDSNNLRSEKDREKRVSYLRKQIEKHEKTIREIREAMHSIDQGVRTLEEIAEKEALMRSLRDSLTKCFAKYKIVNEKSVLIPSETYEEIFRSGFIKKNRSKFNRLYSKEMSQTRKPQSKISKDVLKKLKRLHHERIVERRSTYSYSYSGKNYDSLSSSLEANHHSLSGFAYDLYNDISKKYNPWQLETMSTLGVEVSKVRRAVDISNGADTIYDKFTPILKSMEYLSGMYSLQRRFKTFYILKDKIEEVAKLSREVECLDLIIDAYDNTLLRDSDVLSQLTEIHRKLNKKVNDLSTKVTEMYEKTGLKEYIEIEKKLRELYQRSCLLRHQAVQREEKYGYSDPEARRTNDLYYGAKAEMLSIVIKYPELNRPEYGIDLSKYDKKGRYKGDEPEERVISDYTTRKVKPVVEEEPFKPTRVVTDDEIEQDHRYGTQYNGGSSNSENNNDENTFEIPENLAGLRSAYYGRYMVEKVKHSRLGELKFSEYLKEVAPELVELIKIEERREARAQTVFKLYVKYLASLEDKKSAMKFSEFARLRHGLETDDLPFEYSDEEVKKRLK